MKQLPRIKKCLRHNLTMTIGIERDYKTYLVCSPECDCKGPKRKSNRAARNAWNKQQHGEALEAHAARA